MSDLHFNWPMHPGLVALLVAVSVLLVFRCCMARRTWLISAMRLCALVLIGVALAGPMIGMHRTRAAEKPRLAFLLDDSHSMCVPDVGGAGDEKRRIDAARTIWLEPNFLAQLREQADVRSMRFGERLRPTSIRRLDRGEPEDMRTRIAEAIGGAMDMQGDDGAPISDVLLLTDGVDTDDPTGARMLAMAELAASAGVRIHAVSFGERSDAANVEVYLDMGASSVLDGDQTMLRARVGQTGFDGWPARLVIRELDSGEVVLSEDLQLGRAQEFTTRVQPAGRWSGADDIAIVTYEARIEPLQGESTDDDNSATAHVQVIRDRIRVVLFENEPSWETRFFIASIRADRRIELTTVFGLGQGRQIVHRYDPGVAGASEERPALAPETDAELFEYDMIILGRGCERWFGGLRADLLRRYVVDRGGALILLRGPAANLDAEGAPQAEAMLLDAVLRELAPVEWSDQELEGGALVATREGAQSGLLGEDVWESAEALDGLPKMLSATRIDAEKGLAVVWLRAADDEPTGAELIAGSPAIAHLQVGRGRVLAVLSNGFWRWAFRPESFEPRRDLYRSFWGRALSWLATGGEFLPGQQISVAVEPTSTPPGEPVRIALRMRYFDPSLTDPTVEVRAPGGERITLTMRRDDPTSSELHASFTPTVEGVHEVIATMRWASPSRDPSVATTRFFVNESRIELTDIAARPHVLEQVSQTTGGAFIPFDQPEALLDAIQATSEQTEELVWSSAWDRWWVFALLIGFLGSEWLLRRRQGLL